jgi:hypothetical protein
VTVQQPTQVTSCCNLLAPVRRLSSNSRSARMSFWKARRVSIVEQCLPSCSYQTCQNEFMDIFHNSLVPKKSKVSRLVNRFLSLQKFFTEMHRTWGKKWMQAKLNAVDIFTLNKLFYFNVIYLFHKQNVCQKWGRTTFQSSSTLAGKYQDKNSLHNIGVDGRMLNFMAWTDGLHSTGS